MTENKMILTTVLKVSNKRRPLGDFHFFGLKSSHLKGRANNFGTFGHILILKQVSTNQFETTIKRIQKSEIHHAIVQQDLLSWACHPSSYRDHDLHYLKRNHYFGKSSRIAPSANYQSLCAWPWLLAHSCSYFCLWTSS